MPMKKCNGAVRTQKFVGSTSGVVTVAVPAVAGTWTLTLPDNNGNANDVLTTDGSGVTTWDAPAVYTDIVDLTGGDKTVTASAASGGGTATGTIDVGNSIGAVLALRVKANGDTVDSDIAFYSATGAPAGDLLYEALAKNCFASPYHVDATPWAFPAFATPLVNNLLHYVIKNDGANNSTYDIELVVIGKE